MTGLDRLQEIAEDVGRTVWLRDLGAALSEIAGGIGSPDWWSWDLGDAVEALRWVADRGGLEAVKERMMPEDMEWLLEVWPKWSNGEYCKFGDWWVSDKYGEPKPKQFLKLSIYTPEQLDEWGQGDGESYGYEWDFVRPSDPKYRPDKVEPSAPKVLDADGVEVELGDDLYSVEGSLKFHVSHVDRANGRIATEAMFALDKWADPKMYTHRAPVFAADGRPLREGETVWGVNTGYEYTVAGFNSTTDEDGDPCVMVVCKTESDRRVDIPSNCLTHERPVADTWERLEEDAGKDPCGYFGFDGEETCGRCPASGKNCEQTMARDLVRRAKKLAGVSE